MSSPTSAWNMPVPPDAIYSGVSATPSVVVGLDTAARFAPGSICLAVTSGGINSTTLAIGIGSVSLLIMSFTLIVSVLDASFSKRIALLASTDGLTGLANSATFIERLHQRFAAARRGVCSCRPTSFP